MMQSTFSRFARTAVTRTSLAPSTTIFGNSRWFSSDGSLCDKLAFIGTGKMAQSMIRPLINKGYQPLDKIAIYDVSTSAIKEMKKEFGDSLQAADSIEELVHDADMIICVS